MSRNISSINDNIRVNEGERVGNVSNVNGDVRLKQGAKAESVTAVNGTIKMGQNAEAGALKVVNGDVELGERVTVNGRTESVNGDVLAEEGCVLNGDVATVTGDISLNAVRVSGGLVTVVGNITVGANSVVCGGVWVKKPNPPSHPVSHKPRIEIGPGSVVEGSLRFDHEVELYVSQSAKIGPVSGATPVFFSDGPVDAGRPGPRRFRS